MKELSDQFLVQPSDFARFVDGLGVSSELNEFRLSDLLILPTFKKGLEPLSDDERKYIKKLVGMVEEKYHTLADIRSAFDRNDEIFKTKNDNPDVRFDIVILKKLFNN